MTPAATLRAAARLARERAQEATQGPWEPAVGISGYGVAEDGTLQRDARSNPTMVDVKASGRNAWPAELCTPADAEHIASWSPPVALAIADWWDVAAQAVEETDHTSGWRWALILTTALDAARAYLGETS